MASDSEHNIWPQSAANVPSVRDIEERLSGERLRSLVVEENERLNRLIRNLYVKFRLDRYPSDELYSHICREVAQYFHADVCSLLLLHHEVEEEPGQRQGSPSKLRPYLELKGAFGPWEEALRPKKARRKQIVRYKLYHAKALQSITARAYHTTLPSLAKSREDFELIRTLGRRRGGKSGAGQSGEGPARHLVWHYNNLYYTCRNLIQIPINRADSDLPPIGLLKIENRTPRGIRGFSATAGPEQLFFHELWALAALQPYLKDLTQSDDVFRPVHNNEAWRLRYQDNQPALEYFESLRFWLGERQRKLEKKTELASEERVPKIREKERKKILSRFEELEKRLRWLLAFLSEAETLLQNLAYAQAVLEDVKWKNWIRDDTPPANSMFNAHNLALALMKAAKEDRKWSPDDAESNFDGLTRHLGIPDKSIVITLQQKLEEIGVKFPESEPRPAEANKSDLLIKITEDIAGRDVFAADKRTNNNRRDIGRFLQTREPPFFNFVAATNRLLNFLHDLAEAVRDANVELHDKDHKPARRALARLQAEQRVAKRWANEILDKGRTLEKALESMRDQTLQLIQRERNWQNEIPWLDSALSGPEDPIPDTTPVQAADEDRALRLLLLSRWSAIASRAHSFDETDAYRVMFIAGNVAQVLDNHLMQQARQRRIPCGYRDFAQFGIDPQVLEWLHEVSASSQRLALILCDCFNREWLQRGGVVDPTPCVGLDFNMDLLGPLREAKTRGDDSAIANLVRIHQKPSPFSPTVQDICQWVNDGKQATLSQPIFLPASFPLEERKEQFKEKLAAFLVNLSIEVQNIELESQERNAEEKWLQSLKKHAQNSTGPKLFLECLSRQELEFMVRRSKPPHVLGLRLHPELFSTEPYWSPRWVFAIHRALTSILARFEHG